MKILAIRGSNLASLAGDFEIDLARPPFTDTGLFAIVGNTGAGKSTLLDALCVALFDRTPRLTNHSRVTVGRGDDDPATLGAHDVRTLLRRGAPSGFAEVDFESGDARRYRARWSVRRARNQPDGAIQDQQLTLLAIDSAERLGGTKTETLKAITSRLGLSFDQFRRSALLAQNDFAAFLRADGRDRSELLERMTGTEIYSRLSIEAHLRAALAEQRLRDTRAAALAIPILDEPARSAAEAELALATGARSAARTRFDAAELAARWLAESTARRAALSIAESDHTAAAAAIAAADPDRRELELRLRADKLRSVFETVARLDRELVVVRRDADATAEQARLASEVLAAIGERRVAVAPLLESMRRGRIAAGFREPLVAGATADSSAPEIIAAGSGPHHAHLGATGASSAPGIIAAGSGPHDAPVGATGSAAVGPSTETTPPQITAAGSGGAQVGATGATTVGAKIEARAPELTATDLPISELYAHVGANVDATIGAGLESRATHIKSARSSLRAHVGLRGESSAPEIKTLAVGSGAPVAMREATDDAIRVAREVLPDATWLVGRAALANEIAAWSELDARFAQHASISDAIGTIDRSLAERDTTRAAIASTQKLGAADHQTAAAALADAQRKAVAVSQRRGPSLDAARKQEDDARTRVGDAERLIAIASKARAVTATRIAIDARLAELADAETRDREAHREAETSRERAGILRAERTRVVDELRRAAGYAHARTELRDGEPCPLCGAEEHPWRDRGALDEVIAAAQANLDQALAQLAAATGALAAIAARDEQRGAERLRIAEQRATTLAAAAETATAWRDHLASGGELILDVDPSTAGAEQLATEHDASARKQLETARAARSHAETAAKAASEAQAEVQLAQANVDQLAARLAEITRSLAELDSAVQLLRGERTGRIERRAELTASHETTIDRWIAIDRAAGGPPPPTPESDSLEVALQHSLELVRHQHPRGDEQTTSPRTASRSTSPTRTDATLDAVRTSDAARTPLDARRTSDAVRTGGNQVTPATLEALDRGDLVRARSEMTRFVAAWHERAGRVARSEAELLGVLALIDREARDTERSVTELGARLFASQRRRDELVRELANAMAALETARAAAGFDTERLRALLDDDGARGEQLAARLGALDAAGVRTRAIAGERAQLVADHEATRPDDAVLDDAATLEELAAAVSGAEQHAAKIAAALAANADGVARRELALAAVADDEGRVEIDRILGGVIGSHDGKLFRSFAQSLTLDSLLAVANSHLDELSPRYQLERIPRHDLEIQVIDRDLGAEVRSVQSLSGGESFLVSLALALGLSSMSAHDVRVRTLLIDEGFGTLDPTALDSALAVLDTLQATGRQIGVISHVPALVERVGAHVRVVQRGGGRSEVVVRA